MATIRIGLEKPKFVDDTPMSSGDQEAPTTEQLFEYGQKLKAHLEGFLIGNAYERVLINRGNDFVLCAMEHLHDEAQASFSECDISKKDVTLDEETASLDEVVRRKLKQAIASRELLPLYDKATVLLYKMPWRINWTQERAEVDANCIIYQCVSAWGHDE